ncbi:hypothetical protein HWV62_11377 [Athelia sp. TMB]|nr:hypothetical protein HWV62_26054 [Athelia sp. TMB]KAF7974717.1 hypothetical protein HWV62_11377 [Athelia sp. TMB]
MPKRKLKGLANLGLWSNHAYKLIPKKKQNEKENIPPPNPTPSPPETPKRKRPRLTRLISSSLTSFRARWTRSGPLSVPVDDVPSQSDSNVIAASASLQSLATTPISIRDTACSQGPTIIEAPARTGSQPPSPRVEMDVEVEHGGCAVPEATRIESNNTAEIGTFLPAPGLLDAKSALEDLKRILRPPRKSGPGYEDPKLDPMFRERLEGMKQLLWTYIDPESLTYNQWQAASLRTSRSLGWSVYRARKLREWSRAFILDREDLPYNPYGRWNLSVLDTDETLAQEIHLHLQSIGPYCKAMDIVDFLDTPEMRARTKFEKRMGLSTAQEWMKKLDYRWTLTPKGQYVDGHERPDVVDYRQNVFLPAWSKIKHRTRDFSTQGSRTDPPRHLRHVVVWWHDESQFYANDRRKQRWIHKSEKPVPQPKGQGASQMVADLVSADYGFLRSPDGKQQARRLFKAGKNRDGYFTNIDILEQAHTAMDILEQHYPDEDHILVFDNATTHQKRADGALSARRMPKKSSTSLESNWLVTVKVLDEKGREIVDNGTVVTRRIRMEDGWLPDGRRQSLYFEPGHPQAGLFKGMAVILQERGLVEESQLRSECKGFKCPKGATRCCCRRALYTQPDFVNVKPLLEIQCEARGFAVLFLPKFHCELNFIEQVWGYAKRIYRHYPASSREADLEKNLLAALESVPLETMRKYVFTLC